MNQPSEAAPNPSPIEVDTVQLPTLEGSLGRTALILDANGRWHDGATGQFRNDQQVETIRRKAELATRLARLGTGTVHSADLNFAWETQLSHGEGRTVANTPGTNMITETGRRLQPSLGGTLNTDPVAFATNRSTHRRRIA